MYFYLGIIQVELGRTTMANIVGDGWMPVGLSPAELKPQVDELQHKAMAAGRAKLAVIHLKTLPIRRPA